MSTGHDGMNHPHHECLICAKMWWLAYERRFDAEPTTHPMLIVWLFGSWGIALCILVATAFKLGWVG